MKKLLILLLFIPYMTFSQTYFPVNNLYVKDVFRFGTFYFVKNADSMWIEKPLGTFKQRIDTLDFPTNTVFEDSIAALRGDIGTGGTVYASDGLYKDGDTVKLSDTIKTGRSVIVNDYLEYTAGNAYVDLYQNAMEIQMTGETTGTKILAIDTSGIYYQPGCGPDTTLTTPLHLVTEAQVKREIKASVSRLGRVLKSFYTDSTTVGTSLTDLYRFPIPGGTLATNGDQLICKYSLYGNSATSVILKPHFAGDDFGGVSSVDMGSQFATVFVEIMRSGTDKARQTIKIEIYNSGNVFHSLSITYHFGINWSIDNIMKLISSAASGSVTATMGSIEFKPAAVN
jgi:hypothetical protein